MKEIPLRGGVSHTIRFWGGILQGMFYSVFAVLLAGASISKVLLVFQHMGLCTYSICTYFAHQKKFVFPSILHHWETYRAALIEQIKVMKNVVWSGDGRFDSMGHSAKYGAYTMFCSTIMKIVHFELLQVKLLQLFKKFNLESYVMKDFQYATVLRCKIIWLSILTVWHLEVTWK